MEAAPLEDLVKKITQKIKSFPEPSIRANYLAQQMVELSAKDIAKLLAAIYRRAKENRDDGSLLSIMTLLYEDIFVETLGLTKIGEIYMELEDEEDDEEVSDIIHVAYRRWKEKRNRSQYIPSKDEHVEIRDLTLGEKKFLARKPDRNTIEKIRTVKDPQVVTNLLNNPRAVERDILALITRRPNNPEVLRIVSQHPRWNMRYKIRKALVLNPSTPVDVSLKFLNSLLIQDIKEIIKDKTISPFLRKKAEEMLKKRKKRKES